MDRTLTVHWRHSPDQHEPCFACSDTGKSFRELLEDLLPVFKQEGISLVFLEEPVSAGKSENSTELNGIPLPLLLSRAAEGEEYCHASKCMPGGNLYQSSLSPEGVLCGKAPEILFRKALLLALEEGSGDLLVSSR